MLRRTKGRPVEALGVGRIAAFLLFVEVFFPNCTKPKGCVRLPQGDGAMEWSRLVSSALSLVRGPHTARRDKVRSNCRSWRAEDHSEPVASITRTVAGGSCHCIAATVAAFAGSVGRWPQFSCRYWQSRVSPVLHTSGRSCASRQGALFRWRRGLFTAVTHFARQRARSAFTIFVSTSATRRYV